MRQTKVVKMRKYDDANVTLGFTVTVGLWDLNLYRLKNNFNKVILCYKLIYISFFLFPLMSIRIQCFAEVYL